MPENGSEGGLLEGVFALGASDDEAAAQAALERRVLGELLALRKATGVLTVQKFGQFEALRLVCGGGDLLDAYLMFQRELERYGSATARHPDRTMRRYRLLLDLPAIPPDDGGTADDDVPLLTVSVTGRDAPMRTVFFEDRSRLPPGCHARLACYRSIVTVDVVRDGGDDAG